MAVKYEQVREWVLALPGGEEVMVEEWGHPTLRVNNKMFASGMSGSSHSWCSVAPGSRCRKDGSAACSDGGSVAGSRSVVRMRSTSNVRTSSSTTRSEPA